MHKYGQESWLNNFCPIQYYVGARLKAFGLLGASI